MAYLPDERGYVRKRPTLRKGFWGDHFDELSAIVRGENTRSIMRPVTGWARSQKAEVPNPGPSKKQEPEPEPEPPKPRRGPVPKEIDEDLFAMLWISDVPAWVLERVFGLTYAVLWKRSKDRGFPKRRRGAILKLSLQHGGP